MTLKFGCLRSKIVIIAFSVVLTVMPSLGQGFADDEREIYGESFYLELTISEASDGFAAIHNVRCWKRGDNLLLIIQHDDELKGYGLNSDYAFNVRKLENAKGWSLAKLGGDSVFDKVSPGFLSNVFFGRYIEMTPISEIGLPSFEIDSNTDEAVVRLACDEKDASNPSRYVSSAIAWLTKESKLIARFEANLISASDTAVVKGECRYSSERPPSPSYRKMEYFTSSSPVPDLTITSNVTLFDRRDIAEERFRLTSFGISEPARENKGRRLMFLIGSGIVLLAVLALMARRPSGASGG